MDGLLSRREAAESLGVCLRSLDLIARRREIATIKVGPRRVMIRPKDLTEYVESKRVAPLVKA